VEFWVPEKYVYTTWESPFECWQTRHENGFNVMEFYGLCPSPGTAFVEWGTSLAPRYFALLQNSPNPFNQETVIRYFLPQDSHVKLCIYNLLGQKVKTLVDGPQRADSYAVSWDGKNEKGQDLSSGIVNEPLWVMLKAENTTEGEVFAVSVEPMYGNLFFHIVSSQGDSLEGSYIRGSFGRWPTLDPGQEDVYFVDLV
jgi:hypothetical protein